MTEPTDKSFETNTQPSNFQQRFEDITSRQLDVDTLDTYASAALDDLTELVHEVVATNQVESNLVLTSLEQERRALAKVGLEPGIVERTLDHIQDVSDTIDNLDDTVEALLAGRGSENTPPDQKSIQTGSNEGLRPKVVIPRFKTVLLVLKEVCGIDINTVDSSVFKVLPGIVSREWVRQEPYHYIDIPALNRIVGVCDEIGNRTFVFDREGLDRLGFNVEDIASMKKSEIDEIITQHQGAGRGLIYDKDKFVQDISALLTGESLDDKNDSSNADMLLKKKIEKAPDGVRSVTGVATLYKTTPKRVRRIIDELGIELKEYRFGFRPSLGCAPEDIERIGQVLEAEEHFIESPKDGEVSFPVFCERVNASLGLSLGVSAIRTYINNSSLTLVSVKRKTPRGIFDFYSSADLPSVIAIVAQQQGESKPGDTWKFRRFSNEQIIGLADELSPGKPMSSADIKILAEQGKFPSHGTIIDRFGSVPEFNANRGFEQLKQRGLSDDDIIALAERYWPGRPATQDEINELSKQGMFVSTGTIANRFTSLTEFNRRRGLEVFSSLGMSDEELLNLADKLSPGVALTRAAIDKLSQQGLFMTASGVVNRFGSIAAFNEGRKNSST